MVVLLSNSVKFILAVIWFGTVPASYGFGAPAQRLIMGRVLAVMVVVLVVVLPVTSGETWPLVFILSVRTGHCDDPGRSIVHSARTCCFFHEYSLRVGTFVSRTFVGRTLAARMLAGLTFAARMLAGLRFAARTLLADFLPVKRCVELRSRGARKRSNADTVVPVLRVKHRILVLVVHRDVK